MAGDEVDYERLRAIAHDEGCTPEQREQARGLIARADELDAERERLIAEGVDPAELFEPLGAPGGRGGGAEG